MRIVIVDDFETDRLDLKRMILNCCEKFKIRTDIDSYSSGEDFLDAFCRGSYDLIFMDIYMTGITGMDTAFRLREKNESCALVFVTTSLEHAVASYDVQAAYYLLKPLVQEKFERVMEKVIGEIKKERYIEVMSNRLPVKVPLKQILYADTYQNAVNMHTSAGLIKTYMTFQKFRHLLIEEKCFLDCYKGCIVNMDRISGVTADCFIMDNEDRVPIRKREINTVKNIYTNYLLNQLSED